MNSKTHTDKPWPFPTSEEPDKGQGAAPKREQKQPTEGALDHGIAESFPASDPVSVNVDKAAKKP
jgi:hypothetical protein